MNHAIKATAHEINIRRVAYFYSAAEHRSRGALWPSFAPALISGLPKAFSADNGALVSNEKVAVLRKAVRTIAMNCNHPVMSWDGKDVI